MPQDLNDNWSKHLDDLEEFYHPDKFFADQKTKPNNETAIQDQFFAPSFTEEANLPEEAQLSIDIFQDTNNLYVIAPIAGIRKEGLEVTLDKDILTIRGERGGEFSKEKHNYLYQECYWGKFSRSLVLPVPVDGQKIEATLKDSVLKITLPKVEEEKSISIKIKES